MENVIRQKKLIWVVIAGVFFTLACLPGTTAATPGAGQAPPSSGPTKPSQADDSLDDDIFTRSTPADSPETKPAQGSELSALLATRSAPSEPIPWLVFSAGADPDQGETLWALRADGTEVRHLTDDWVWVFSVQPQAADGTTRVAYITSTISSGSKTGLTLKMVSLPDGQIETITPLTSPETTYTNQDANDSSSNFQQVSNIADAITFENSVAWSPDGRWIAFVGAMDGPSADVYSYEVATGEIRHLTSGADHAFQLLWSPDSRWILHIAQEEFARSGGIYEAATGIWAAAPDGSAVNELEGERASEFLGWADANTLVVEGGGRMGPGRDLRLIDIATGSINNLEPACYDGVAYDLRQRVYLVQMSGNWGDSFCAGQSDWGQGLYLVKNGNRTLIPDLDVFELTWSPVFDVFFAMQKDAPIAISPSGEVLPDFASQVPSRSITASPDGSMLAWFEGASLFVAIGQDYQPVQVPGVFYSRQEALAWSK